MNIKKFVLVFVLGLVLFGFINVYAAESISEVSISIPEPVIGDKVSNIKSGISIPSDANYSIVEDEEVAGPMWWESESGMIFGSMTDDSVFQDNYMYTYSIMLKPSDNYEFPVDENGGYTGSVSVTGPQYQETYVDEDGYLSLFGNYIQFGDINYHVIEGADQTYTIGESTAANFTIDGDYEYFDEDTRVIVDDKKIYSNNYTCTKDGNNTIVTLKKDYLDKLAIGKHTLIIAGNNNKSAETIFTIAKSDNNESNSDNNTQLEITPPNTGINDIANDNNVLVYLLVTLTSIIGFSMRYIISRKRYNLK